MFSAATVEAMLPAKAAGASDRGGTQDKLQEYKSAQKPTQNFEARHARSRRNLQVKILRGSSRRLLGWRVSAQNAETRRETTAVASANGQQWL